MINTIPKGALLKLKKIKEYDEDGRMLVQGVLCFDKLRPYITKEEKFSWITGKQANGYPFNRYISNLYAGKYAESDGTEMGDRTRFLNNPYYVCVDKITEEIFNAFIHDGLIGSAYYYPTGYSEIDYDIGIPQGLLWMDQNLSSKNYEVYGIPMIYRGLKAKEFHISVSKEHRRKGIAGDLLRVAAEDNLGRYSALVCLWDELNLEKSVSNVNLFMKMEYEGWQMPKNGIAFKLLS